MDTTADAAPADVAGLRLRDCRGSPAVQRDALARLLYDRLHPAMAALGLLFLVVVLAQNAARDGTALHGVLLTATWILWAVFAGEYGLRLAIAPSKAAFLRSTWWQLAFLAVPFLTMVRALLVLRVARPTRVAVAALRGTRSARMTLTSRAAWLAVLSAIVVFAAADVLYSTGAVQPYGRALHSAALGAVNGEPIGSDHWVAQMLSIALALYAVVFFAALAGIVGAFLMEQRHEQRAEVAVADQGTAL